MTEESRPLGSVATLAGNPPTILAYLAPPTILREAEEAEERRLLGSVATPCGSGDPPTRPAYSASCHLTVLGGAEESRPSGPGAVLLVILDSAAHSSASSDLLTRGFPELVGCTSQCAAPALPITGSRLTDSSPGVWASGIAPPVIGPLLTDPSSEMWASGLAPPIICPHLTDPSSGVWASGLAPPIIGPHLTDPSSGVWASGLPPRIICLHLTESSSGVWASGLAPPIIGPHLTESSSGVWAGPLRSKSIGHPMGGAASAM